MNDKEMIEIANRIISSLNHGDCDDAYRLALYVLASMQEDDDLCRKEIEVNGNT